MAFFRYTATDQSGRDVTGTIQATSEFVAVDEVTKRGYENVRIETGARNASSTASATPVVRTRRATSSERLFFFAQAATLLKSGIAPNRAFDALAGRVSNRNLATISREIAAHAIEGGGISKVMEVYVDVFSHSDVATVRAGEMGGFLVEAFEFLATHHSESAKFNRRFWVIRLATWQGALALIFVIPLPMAMLDGFLRGGTPKFLQTYFSGLLWPVLPIAAALYVIGWVIRSHYAKHENTRKRHAIILKLPRGIGYRAQRESLRAFLWTLRNLWSAGIAPGTSWQLAAASAPNAEYAVRLSKASDIRGGERPISESLIQSGLFPVEYAGMLATAEQSGDVANTLGHMTEIMTEEFDAATDRAKLGIWLTSFTIVTVLGVAAWLIFYSGYFGQIFDYVDQWVNE